MSIKPSKLKLREEDFIIICYPAAQFTQVLYLSSILRYFQFPLHYIYSMPLVSSVSDIPIIQCW